MDNNDFKFTEEYIQRQLNNFFSTSAKKYVMENLYVFDWESDKLIETRAGLIYEFEIKISRADFFKDFEKKDKHIVLEGKEEVLPSYEANCKAWGTDAIDKKFYLVKNRKKPNYFYYAVPEGLVTEEEVPEYAGLIYVEGDVPQRGYGYTGLRVIKTAPKLHKGKYTDEELNLTEKFYYNMAGWKDKYNAEHDRRMLMEDKSHKVPYPELYEKYEGLKKENNALKTLADTESKNARLFSETMRDDLRIIRRYREKMIELSPDFDFIEFEDKIFEE